ncbi:MAG: amino acid carrier protein [Candidatus Babeliales bacterium]
MNLSHSILQFADVLWGLPFTGSIVISGLIITIALGFVQFRYFIRGWQLIFAPVERTKSSSELTPLQAFINTLGGSIGVGTIAGVSTALYSGGPGSIFWMLIVGSIGMAVRFAEVYLSTAFIGKAKFRNATGGPMLYLSKIPAGPFFSISYAFFCLVFALVAGNGIQANSVALGASAAWGLSPYLSGAALFLFMLYALMGGSDRLISLSDKLVPFKVGTFLISAIIILVYHAASIIPAFKLILASVFMPSAVLGGLAGATIQQALRYGFARGIFANEAGVGTAAVLFGSTKGKNPVEDGILSMIGVFITTHIVGLAMALILLASGVWNNGLTSTALTISAYNTVFGDLGGWIVTLLAISFGSSVMITYAFIGKQCWEFLFGKKGILIYSGIYAVATFFGAIMQVDLLWGIGDLINAAMIGINLFGILWLLKIIRKGLMGYSMHK